MDKNLKIAEEVLAAVGGKENVTFVNHCMTRLRFNLKDESIVNDENVKNISGVIGVAKNGGQYQVIIGQNVPHVYAHICEIGNFATEKAVEENLDVPKSKKTLGGFFGNIMSTLAGCVTPLIPIMMAASMFKMLVAVLGPGMLGVMSEKSNLYTLFTFVGDAGFYFMPIFVGYTAAKKMSANPMIGMFLGAVLLHPTFVGMVGGKASFDVMGIPCTPQAYASSILPTILSVFVLKYVEKLLHKIIPEVVSTIFVPFISAFIMLPIMLCFLAPIGGWIGSALSTFLLGLGGIPVIGVLAIALIGGCWQFLVMTGMHQVLIASMVIVFSTNGFEGTVSPAAACCSIAVSGMLLGSYLRIKDPEEKNLTLGYLIAAFVGGITEPGLYGNGLKFKRPFIGLFCGGFCGALFCAITGTKAYTLVAVASFLTATGFAGGPTSNLICGIIACVISFVVAAVVTYFVGYKKDDVVVQSR